MGRGLGHTNNYVQAKYHELRKIVAEENGTALTDQQIAQKLCERGFPTSIKRVSKIRKQFGIPNSYLRRKHERREALVHGEEV